MLYTVIYKEKYIVEADNAVEAEQLALEDNNAIKQKDLLVTRPTTKSEHIWAGLDPKSK